MAVSTGMKIAGGVGATTAVVAPATAGMIYGEKIGELMGVQSDSSPDKEQSKGDSQDDSLKEGNQARDKQGKSGITEAEILKKLNEKITSLGFPNECKLVNISTHRDCELDNGQLGKLKFATENRNTTPISGKVKLKVEKTSDDNFPQNLKFTFSSEEEDYIAHGTEPNAILIKKGKSNDFRIKVEGGKSKLEKVYDVEELGFGVRFDCEETNKKCTLNSGDGIYVWINENTKLENVFWPANKEISFVDRQQGYNQGFKFVFTEDIGTTFGEVTKTVKKGNYEIKYHGDKWWLFRKGDLG